MSNLSINNVGKIYPNGKEVIKGATITIEDGEFTVFVGPSGCGKSTLLRMVAGLESVTSGEILLNDKIINDLEPADRDIAMVFQNYALYPHMTVYKNLAYGLANRKFPKDKIEQRVRETAKLLQIEDYLDNKPNELSGGQRQRVAMGRAIVREPQLFLFDEPLSNLDAKLRNTMRLEIKALQKRLKTTVVYVTHDQVEAMTMADKIVILYDGKVEQVGKPKDIYHNPANLFVATFMGSPAMNILNASLSAKTLDFDGDNHIRLDCKLSDDSQKKPLKVGIRPECMVLHKEVPTDNDPYLTTTVEIVEDLGASRVVHASVGSQTFLVVSELQSINEGDKVYVSFPSSSICFFDSESGENISSTVRIA